MKSRKSTSVGMLVVRAAATLAAVAVTAKLIRSTWARANYPFKRKAVLITGGSRGLGLAMARQFAREGARLAIVARDKTELIEAAEQLRRCGAEAVFTYACDLRDRNAAEAMVQAVATEFGRIDILINNAGIIIVGPFENQEIKDFEASMDLHAWAPLIITRAALPHMPKNGTGRIVNISSIGGRLAPPHLAAYCMSKFAETGLSDALGVALARQRIPVTTVLPGLMRTGSHGYASTRGKSKQESAWFSKVATLPLLTMNSTRAARQIVEACRQGRRRLIITWQARLAVLAEAVAPNLTLTAFSLVNRLLPSPEVTNPQPQYAGTRQMEKESRRTAPRWLTWLTNRAELLYHELRR